MADRPNSFNVTIPTGADSPRNGDNELRDIKRFTQNAYNDMTAVAGVGVQRSNVFANNFYGNLGPAENAANTSAAINGTPFATFQSVTTNTTVTPTHWQTGVYVPTGTVAITIANGNTPGQLINISADATATLTVTYTTGEGISLGDAVKISSGIWNGANWDFSETVK